MKSVLLLLSVVVSLSGCIVVRETSDTYTLPAADRVIVRGAAVAGEFVPANGSAGLSFSAMVVGGASGKRFGPYEFVLYATGKPGQHRSMTVHGVSFRSGRGLTDKVPAEYTGRVVVFSESMRKDTVQATWHSPGVLKLDFTADETATVTADVSIADSTGTERRTVTLTFKKITEKNHGIVNAPAEIIRQMGKDIPFEDTEIGANRKGWQPRQAEVRR